MECEYYKNCVNYVRARDPKTNKLLSIGICGQMNCERNPMRVYTVDMYKSKEKKTQEEIERMKVEEELRKRAEIKVEKIMRENRKEEETKKPREYASVKDIIKQVTMTTEKEKEKISDGRIKDEELLENRMKKIEERRKEEKMRGIKEKEKEKEKEIEEEEKEKINRELKEKEEFMLKELKRLRNKKLIKALQKKAEELGLINVVTQAKKKLEELGE